MAHAFEGPQSGVWHQFGHQTLDFRGSNLVLGSRQDQGWRRNVGQQRGEVFLQETALKGQDYFGSGFSSFGCVPLYQARFGLRTEPFLGIGQQPCLGSLFLKRPAPHSGVDARSHLGQFGGGCHQAETMEPMREVVGEA